MEGFTDNLRESGYCGQCGSWSRPRQLAAVLLDAAERLGASPAGSLSELGTSSSLTLYNTEAQGPVHEALSAMPGYVCSEYFGDDMAPGVVQPNGTRHEDLQRLSFPNDSLDLVVSSDVLEHVPEPYVAHREIHRVLRRGGRHVFTAPYRADAALDDVRARRLADGSIEHLVEPEYHNDPVRRDRIALVYTIFGLEMIPNLTRAGFDVRVLRPWDPRRGLVDPNAMVFDAVKRAGPAARR